MCPGDYRIGAKSLIKLGQIYREHGVKGFCKFYSYSGTADHLVPGQEYLLKNPDGREQKVNILDVRPFQRYFLVRFDLFDSPEPIQGWRGATLWIEKRRLKRKEGEFFDFEWEGFAVLNRKRQPVGTVRQMIRNPLRQFVVDLNAGFGGGDVMIPYVREWILELDEDKRRIVLDLPEGLL